MLRAAIAADLSACPTDVIEQWFLPYAKSEGWPPASSHAAVPTNRWRYLLGGLPLQHFQRLVWHVRKAPLLVSDLCPGTRAVIAQMVAGAYWGVSNAYTRGLPRLREGIDGYLQHLARGEALPRPILEQHPSGLSIHDGSHRVCALLIASAQVRTPVLAAMNMPAQEYWVGQSDPLSLCPE